MARISILILMLCWESALGQVVTREFYYRNDQLTDSLNSYYYKQGKPGRLIDLSHVGWTTISKNKLKSSLDTVYSYYTRTGKIKARQIYYEGMLNGPFISYYENGRIREKGIYTDDSPVGYFMSWYEAGIPYQTLQYPEKKASNGTSSPSLINYWDSLGRPLVNNSNGFCTCYKVVENNAILKEKGKIINGKRDSVWIGFLNDTLSFREHYENGQFLEGVRFDQQGDFKYDMVEQQPEYPGGMGVMMKFLAKTMKYPQQARRMGTEGRVSVGFIVNREGRITDVAIVKGISAECDDEAARVVSVMPAWKPGRIRGAPVKVRFILPINFKLPE